MKLSEGCNSGCELPGVVMYLRTHSFRIRRAQKIARHYILPDVPTADVDFLVGDIKYKSRIVAFRKNSDKFSARNNLLLFIRESLVFPSAIQKLTKWKTEYVRLGGNFEVCISFTLQLFILV